MEGITSLGLELTKSKERVREYGEVFTPIHIVKQMCDMLEDENPNRCVFEPSTTFLEPSCGEGVFIIEILRRKFANCKNRNDYTISLNSVYGFELLADNVTKTIANVTLLCEEYFKPTKKEREIINEHIIQCDSLKILKLLNIYGDMPPKQINILPDVDGICTRLNDRMMTESEVNNK